MRLIAINRLTALVYFIHGYFFPLTYFIILIYVIYKTMIKRRQAEEYLIFPAPSTKG